MPLFHPLPIKTDTLALIVESDEESSSQHEEMKPFPEEVKQSVLSALAERDLEKAIETLNYTRNEYIEDEAYYLFLLSALKTINEELIKAAKSEPSTLEPLSFYTVLVMQLNNLYHHLDAVFWDLEKQHPHLENSDQTAVDFKLFLIDKATFDLNDGDIGQTLIQHPELITKIPQTIMDIYFDEGVHSEKDSQLLNSIGNYLFTITESISIDMLKQKLAIKRAVSALATHTAPIFLKHLTEKNPIEKMPSENYITILKNRISKVDKKPSTTLQSRARLTLNQFKPSPALVHNLPDKKDYQSIQHVFFDYDDTIYNLNALKTTQITDPLEAMDKKLCELFHIAHHHLKLNMHIITARNQELDTAERWAHLSNENELFVVKSLNHRIPVVIAHRQLEPIFAKERIIYCNFMKSVKHGDGSVQLLAEQAKSRKIPDFEAYCAQHGLDKSHTAIFDDSLGVWSTSNLCVQLLPGILFHHVDNEHPVKNIFTSFKHTLEGIILHNENIPLSQRQEAARALVDMLEKYEMTVSPDIQAMIRPSGFTPQ